MIRFAICDDDKNLSNLLCEEVAEFSKTENITYSVEVFPSADAFLFAWEGRQDIDILLLDIEMPGMDGIGLAKKLRGQGVRPCILFVTGYPEFALEGYDLEAVSYILKPIDRRRLHAGLKRALEKADSENALILPLSAGETMRLYPSQICFLEGDNHKTVLWLTDGGSLSCTLSLRQLELELAGGPEAFFKPHRSYYINLGRVSKITRKEILMENNRLVPIARGKWEELNQAYMRHYRRQSF